MWYPVPALEWLRTGVYTLQKGIPMVMQRWGSVLLMLVFVLAACGTADTSDIALSDTGVEPSATADGAYPTAQNAAPTATHAPTQEATSAPAEIERSQPTSEVIEAAATEQTPILPHIEISLTDVITIEQHAASAALYSWSPDGSMILFSNLGADYDRISVFNINTRKVTTIEREASTRLEMEGGIVLDYIEPLWTPDCCTIIVPKPGPSEATQQLMLYQADGTPVEDLGIFPQGPFYLDAQDEIIVLNEQGLSRGASSDSQPLSGIDDVYARLRMTPANNGQFFYPEHKTVLHLYDPLTKKDRFSLDITDLPDSDKSLTEAAEFGPHAMLPNGQEIMFWVKDGANASLWITDLKSGNSHKIIHTLAAPFHMSLSPDATKLVWTESVHRAGKAISVLDIQTGQSISLGGGFDTTALWHPTKPVFITSRVAGDSLQDLQRIFYIYKVNP